MAQLKSGSSAKGKVHDMKTESSVQNKVATALAIGALATGGFSRVAFSQQVRADTPTSSALRSVEHAKQAPTLQSGWDGRQDLLVVGDPHLTSLHYQSISDLVQQHKHISVVLIEKGSTVSARNAEGKPIASWKAVDEILQTGMQGKDTKQYVLYITFDREKDHKRVGLVLNPSLHSPEVAKNLWSTNIAPTAVPLFKSGDIVAGLSQSMQLADASLGIGDASDNISLTTAALVGGSVLVVGVIGGALYLNSRRRRETEFRQERFGRASDGYARTRSGSVSSRSSASNHPTQTYYSHDASHSQYDDHESADRTGRVIGVIESVLDRDNTSSARESSPSAETSQPASSSSWFSGSSTTSSSNDSSSSYDSSSSDSGGGDSGGGDGGGGD